MPPLEIRTLLADRGATMSAIAESLSVSPATVRKVIYGEIKSRRVALTIAEFLERDVEDLWPGKYPDRYTPRSAHATLRAQLAAAASLAEKKAAANANRVAQAA